MKHSKIVEMDSKLVIEVDGQIIQPYAFMTYNPDSCRYSSFQKEGMKLFSLSVYAGDQGINSFSGIRPFRDGFYKGENTYDFNSVSEDLAKISEHSNEVYVILRVYLDVPKWWENKNKHELARDFQGQPLRQSFSSEKWRKDMKNALTELIEFIDNSQWADIVIGYQVAAGGTEEWAYHRRYCEQLSDYSQVASKRYKKWLKDKYKDISVVNSCHVKAYNDFDEICVPTPVKRMYSKNGVLRKLPDENDVVDYYEFHNYIVAEAIVYFAKTVKQVTNGKALCGAFYGYVTEIMNIDFGHHALSYILNCKDIDFLASPNSYIGGRDINNDWPSMSAVDSALLHKKLWFIESDTRTNKTTLLKDKMLASCPDYPAYEGGVWKGPISEAESISLIKRNTARVLTTGVGCWWFDMWGGWFDSQEIRDIISKTHAELDKIHNRYFVPQIAFIIDERGFSSFSFDTPELYQLIYEQRRELGCMGAPYSVFLSSDLSNPNFDFSGYRVFIFTNLVNPTDQMISSINKLKCNNNTLVWLYFSDLYNKGECSEFDVKYSLEEPAMQGEYNSQKFPPIPVKCPRFANENPKDYTLAYFAETATPCVMWRQEDSYNSVYSLLPRLPTELLAKIATMAGVHLYNRSQEIVYAGFDYISICALSGGYKRLYFQSEPTEVKDVFESENIRTNGMFIDFYMKEHETKLFKIAF